MSYLIKLQPAPSLFDSVLNNSKHGSTMYHSLTPNFHRLHIIFRSNVKELSTSLKVLPLLKNTDPKSDEDLKEGVNSLAKLSKLMKISNPRTNRKKGAKLLKKNSNFTSKFDNNYNFDSTKSYDPNLLDRNLEIEETFKLEYGSSKNFTNTKLDGSLIPKNLEKIPENALTSNTEKATKNNILENLSKKGNGQNEITSQVSQKSLTATGSDLYRSLGIIKGGQSESISNPLNKPTPLLQNDQKYALREIIKVVSQKSVRKLKNSNTQKEINFENFTSHLSPYTKMVQEILSSLDIFITNNNVLDGFELLVTQRKKSQWNEIVKREKKCLGDIYTMLLHGLSEKGYWDFMQNVTSWMALDNIKLDSESFAALFYCLAVEKNFKNEKLKLEEVNNVINQLFVNNISLDDIFSKAILSKDKAEKILTLIQKAVPSFDIQPVTINLSSDCPLIKNLLITENNLESPVDNMNIETLRNKVEEQLLLEEKYLINVKAVSTGNSGEASPSYKQKLDKLKKEWRNSIERSLYISINQLQLRNSDLCVYLNSIPPEDIVDILMETALNLMEFSGGYSPNVSGVSLLLSSKIAYRYQIKKKHITKNIERTKALFSHYLSWYLDPSGPARNARQKWQMLIQITDNTSQLDSKIIDWPIHVKIALGKFLINIIIKELKFPLEKVKKYYPVFCTIFRYRDGIWHEEIKCHPNISNLFQKLGFGNIIFRADQMPMVCPPKPWKSVNHGGYLSLPSEFIRKPFSTAGKILRLEDIPLKNVYPTMDALNVLQGVPWMINESVLNVALNVFKQGGSQKLGVPHFPEPVNYEKKKYKESTFKERLANQLQKKELIKKRCEEYSLWVEALYRLSLANHYRGKLFWLPQNCDFRGRVYPVPALLNHLGADLYRSLLIFGKGKPLGPKGLDWLKIHLINLTGKYKKKNILERLAISNEVLPLILDSAEKPLTGSKWWMESDEPWQTLATCMEIKNVLYSRDPENYICNFPIHQDGSCNGLQHYAGLGKDSIGAQSVNLASMNSPQDVYNVVAQLIDEEREKDEKNGVQIASKLRGLIERKIIKQTVMTTVYGVTSYGAKLQIAKKLEEIPNFPKEYIKPGAAYLTYKTFFCLKKMFNSAKEIQDWLVLCAGAINSLDDYVQWVSPLGLPVLQCYAKFKMNPELKKSFATPDKLKQKNAFPPNFIHSLDSAHMMLTALFCEQAGITFASVHDCFWTHPNNVDLMNKICREQFVSLHSQPILENLSQFFVRQYLQNNVSENEALATVFEAVPEKGSFDLKEVLNSVYFFS